MEIPIATELKRKVTLTSSGYIQKNPGFTKSCYHFSSQISLLFWYAFLNSSPSISTSSSVLNTPCKKNILWVTSECQNISVNAFKTNKYTDMR